MPKKIILRTQVIALALIMALGMFSVPAIAAGVTLSLDQTDYKAGALITITYSGVTDEQIAAEAVVAYYRQGAPSSEYIKKMYVNENSGTVTIWAHHETGNYEMRFYKARSISDENLVASATVKFTIGGGSATTQPPTTQPPTTQPPTQTTDKPSSWAEEQVNKAITEKLVPQSLQSKYTQTITRAEFCALAVLLYENIKDTITGRTTFTDTKDVNVEKMASVGVVSGVGNNKFDPDAKLTREQAAVMLSRLAEKVGKPFEKKAAMFADNSKISSWALEGVGQVQAAGIMGGVGNNTFAPQDPYTREQSIITIMRTYDAVKGGGTTGTTGTTKPTDPPATTEPTEPPSGSVDSKLVGNWRCNRTISGSTGTITALYQFYFNEDGSFKYYYIPGAYAYEYEGKYSASDGKVYLYDIKRLTNPDEGEHPVNKTMEYAFGTDDTGAYLAIGLMNAYTDQTYVEVPNNVKFRKSAATTEPTKPTDPPKTENPDFTGLWVPRPDYTKESGDWLEFKSDGTFILTIKVEGVGYNTIKGKYALQKDKITCTKVTYSWTEYGYQGRNYTDRPGDDLTWTYYFASSTGIDVLDRSYPNTTWLAIKLNLDNTDKESWFAKSTV